METGRKKERKNLSPYFISVDETLSGRSCYAAMPQRSLWAMLIQEKMGKSLCQL